MTEEHLANRYFLGGVVTTVDFVNAGASLEAHAECVKQVSVADRILLTKTDLAKGPDLQAQLKNMQRRLRRLNPGAPILDRHDPSFDFRHLFDTDLYDPATKGTDVERWLSAEAYEEDSHSHHDHHGHDHDITRHGTEVRAFSLVLDEPVPAMAFSFALELLIANRGENLLRVKGIVNLAERPEAPVIIHGVQHIFHEPIELDEWPTDDHRTKLVFITRNIPQETIETFFRAWQRLGIEQEDSARRTQAPQ